MSRSKPREVTLERVQAYNGVPPCDLCKLSPKKGAVCMMGMNDDHELTCTQNTYWRIKE